MASKFVPQHLTQAQIASLTTDELRAIIRSTVRTGVFAAEVVWAECELARRVDLGLE